MRWKQTLDLLTPGDDGWKESPTVSSAPENAVFLKHLASRMPMFAHDRDKSGPIEPIAISAGTPGQPWLFPNRTSPIWCRSCSRRPLPFSNHRSRRLFECPFGDRARSNAFCEAYRQSMWRTLITAFLKPGFGQHLVLQKLRRPLNSRSVTYFYA